MITIDVFNQVDIRVGKIIEVNDFPQARKPAYHLVIDLGSEIGIKQSCAQITVHYTKETLLNSLVLCVVNFPPRKIGPHTSEVLTLGVPDENGNVVLVRPSLNVPLGGRLF